MKRANIKIRQFINNSRNQVEIKIYKNIKYMKYCKLSYINYKFKFLYSPITISTLCVNNEFKSVPRE